LNNYIFQVIPSLFINIFLKLHSFSELHLAPKTTTVPVSARHDNKPRKKTAPHSKDSKRKRKRPKGDRREEEDFASGEDDEDLEAVTTGSWPELRTVQTIIPSASRPPSSNPHRNGADNAAAGSSSYDCRMSSVRLPLWATAVIVVQVALKHLLNCYYVIIF
jgi:hypothetical protein